MRRFHFTVLHFALGGWSLGACLGDLRPEVGAPEEPARPGSAESRTASSAPEPAEGTTEGRTGEHEGAADGPAETSEGGGTGVEAADEHGVDCTVRDSDPDREVSFTADIWPILSGCRCHDSGSDDPTGILEVALTIDDYDSLREGGDRTGRDIVVPFDACRSLLLAKLSDRPPFGERMPRDGPYLSAEERALLSDWIAEGARDN